jgi:hypothetical protein
MFFGIGLHSFCEAAPQKPAQRHTESLLYLENGYRQLLLNESKQALTDFENATASLEDIDKSSCAINFLISFGQVIAYDSLGFREECMQSVGSLLFAITAYDERNYGTEIGTSQDVLSPIEYETTIGFLTTLSTVAPSPEVQDLLFSIIDEMAEEFLPAFKFAEQPFSNTVSWDYDYEKEASIENCKSFFKRLKNILKEVSDYIYYIAKGLKAAKEAKENYDALKQTFRRK